MDDTPEHVKQIQREIWLSKSPEERLRLTIKNKEDLFAIWNELKKNDAAAKMQNDKHKGELSPEVPE
jgi:hypothetical protein